MDLRHHLRNAGLRQRGLARDLGVSEATVSKWLSGKQAIPAATVLDLANALNVPTDTLLRELATTPAQPGAA